MSFSVIMGIYLLVLAADDMFKKSVPVALLAAGAVPVVMSFFCGPRPSPTDRLLGLAVGLILLLAAKLSKEMIGYGDAAVLCITGTATGLGMTAVITAVSLFLLLAYSVTMLAKGRLNKKSRIPFLPFIFAGYVLTQFMRAGGV
ncbi:MAG: prepilin peptidase [Lachnospiraceae bacterium]|nr:prepilin peptidase [Lachnospiraceae bacterium]